MGRVLITGCSTGIGRAAAVELTKRGHDVVATARKVETLDELDVAARLALDVTDDASVAAALKSAGELDVLVNNAGFGVVGPIEKLPIAEGQRQMETNFFGTVRMIQAVLPGMRARGNGTIVNVSSIAGRVAPPLDGFYGGSKFAVEGMSEALHYEVQHFGIHVRIVEPGVFATGFQDNAASYGTDTAPYDELARQWETARGKLLGDGAAPGPETVAAVIADAIESTERQLRWPVGDDASMVLGARSTMDDEAFEDAMRGVLGLTW